MQRVLDLPNQNEILGYARERGLVIPDGSYFGGHPILCPEHAPGRGPSAGRLVHQRKFPGLAHFKILIEEGIALMMHDFRAVVLQFSRLCYTTDSIRNPQNSIADGGRESGINVFGEKMSDEPVARSSPIRAPSGPESFPQLLLPRRIILNSQHRKIAFP